MIAVKSRTDCHVLHDGNISDGKKRAHLAQGEGQVGAPRAHTFGIVHVLQRRADGAPALKPGVARGLDPFANPLFLRLIGPHKIKFVRFPRVLDFEESASMRPPSRVMDRDQKALRALTPDLKTNFVFLVALFTLLPFYF